MTAVYNRYSQSNIKFTNCNTKIPAKANSVLIAITRLNSFGRFNAFGLIGATWSTMCYELGQTILNNNLKQSFWN